MADAISKFTHSQTIALGLLQTGQNVFITGAPGTGKSFLIREFIRSQGEKLPVLASTGAAAILVGGRTFHSFFGLGRMQGGREAVLESALKNSRLKSRIRKTERLIIDEVSMLSFEVLDIAEEICRKVRASDEAWGGVQVICVGDFAQLPPVSRSKKKEWAFLGEAWARSGFKLCELKEVVRQEDEDFVRILQKLRFGDLDSEVEDFLNRRCADISDLQVPHIFPRRDQVDKFNFERLEELPGEMHFYKTNYFGESRYIEILEREAPVAPVLSLKEGALVMIRVNDPKQRYVNGSLATVYSAEKNSLVVELRGRLIELEKFHFAYQNADGEEVAYAENFPVSLAYAQTIHKSQGASMDRLHADLTRLWEPGQAYVVLSRVKSAEGLSLVGWNRNSVFADPMVQQFYA